MSRIANNNRLHGEGGSAISYQCFPRVDDEALNALFAASWPDHRPGDFTEVLNRCAPYVCAYDGERLVGFAKVVWDGGIHGFLLDPTVHPDYRRRGIGRRLVELAASGARERGIKWLHVDYVPALEPFYRGCGFRQTAAGLMDLQQ